MKTPGRAVSIVLLALGAALASRPAVAMTSDNVGARVVVPFVAHTKSLRTTVSIENHEPVPVKATLYYVGEQSSSSPGLRKCPAGSVPFVLLPSSVVLIDVATLCALNGPDDVGTLTVIELQGGTTARLSANARVDLLDPAGQPDFGFSVEGIPLGYLDGSNNTHVVSALRYGASISGFGDYVSDCYVGSFFDATSSGVVAKLTLKDRDGRRIGSPLTTSLRPWELVRLPDVFGAAGTGGPYQQARAEFVFSGNDPSVLAFCTVANVVNRRSPSTTFHLAKVVEPELETRRRDVNVNATPRVTPSGGSFEFLPGTSEVLHGLYVRHPDLLSCALDRSELVLELVTPDGAQTFGGTTNAIAEFDTGARSALGSRSFGPGWADLWGLRVSWNAAFPAPTGPVPYRVVCRSGNGVSLVDQIVRN